MWAGAFEIHGSKPAATYSGSSHRLAIAWRRLRIGDDHEGRALAEAGRRSLATSLDDSFQASSAHRVGQVVAHHPPVSKDVLELHQTSRSIPCRIARSKPMAMAISPIASVNSMVPLLNASMAEIRSARPSPASRKSLQCGRPLASTRRAGSAVPNQSSIAMVASRTTTWTLSAVAKKNMYRSPAQTASAKQNRP